MADEENQGNDTPPPETDGGSGEEQGGGYPDVTETGLNRRGAHDTDVVIGGFRERGGDGDDPAPRGTATESEE